MGTKFEKEKIGESPSESVGPIDASVIDQDVRAHLGLPDFLSYKEAQLEADKTPKPSVLVVGLGPGARVIIDHYAQKGFAVDAVDAQIDIGGRLRNVAPSKQHYPTGLKELFGAISHPNVHTITGIQIGFTEQEKGDISLNDLVRLGRYNAVFLAVGTKETQTILQNGNNLGWEPEHEYGYSFTERAYRWVREGNAIGDLDCDFIESGETVYINGVGFVGIEDTARIVQAIQIDRSLRAHGIQISSEELIENPRRAMAALQKRQDAQGEAFRALMGEVDFDDKEKPEEARRALQEKLGIKPLVALYRKSEEVLLTKLNEKQINAFANGAFFTIQYSREIGAVVRENEVKYLQLVERLPDGALQPREKVRHARVFSAIGGVRPDVQFHSHTIQAGRMTEIDGVVIGFAGNATESKGNKRASEDDAKARIKEADALLKDVESPGEEAWVNRMAFVQNLELFAHQKRGSDGNIVRDTLRQIPGYTINKWQWSSGENREPVTSERPSLQGSDVLLRNIEAIVPHLPFVESGILRNGDVSLVPVFDEAWREIVGYEVFFTHTDSLNRVVGVRSLGLRITEQGLERQYASALPWLPVEKPFEVQGVVYSRSQIQYTPSIGEIYP